MQDQGRATVEAGRADRVECSFDRAEAPSPQSNAAPRVIACVDSSAYLESVCDHAAWFASRLGDPVELLNVAEAPSEAPDPDVLQRAAERLDQEGASALDRCTGHGELCAALNSLAWPARVVVIGRGRHGGAGGLRQVGHQVMQVIERLNAPVCIAPKLFLPISRVSVIHEAAGEDHAFADRVATSPLLDGLEITLTTPFPDGRLAPGIAATADPEPGRTGSDLLVLSRTSLFGPASEPGRMAALRLLRSRLPVLVF